MNSVGIDLHKRRSQVAVVSEDGRRLLSCRIDNDPQTFLGLLREIDGESKIAVEATYGWEWLADVLEEAGYELHLAHPLRTKAIASARVKTDSVDATTLAQLLRADLLPDIAPRELRDAHAHALGAQEPRPRAAVPPGDSPRARGSVRQGRA
jgi:transposase